MKNHYSSTMRNKMAPKGKGPKITGGLKPTKTTKYSGAMK